MRVLITGATGTVGAQTALLLVARGVPVRLMTRDPRSSSARALEERLRGAAPAGAARAEMVAVDLADRRRLTELLTGVDAVLVVTTDPLRSEHDAHLVGGALAAGVGIRLVKLSALAVADPLAQDLVTRWQRDNESRIVASGLPWTLLRPRAFMSNTLAWRHEIRQHGRIGVLSPDARTACVDPRDVAEVAARVLGETGHENRTYALTGPEAVSAREQAAQLAKLLGRKVPVREITPSQAASRLRAKHPEPVVQALLESAERQRAGGKSRVEQGVRLVAGRAPAGYRKWARDHLEHFR